jgi:hypothetical protein
MERMKANSTKSRSTKWVVISSNPDGTPFTIKCDDESHARKLAKEVKGKVRREGK